MWAVCLCVIRHNSSFGVHRLVDWGGGAGKQFLPRAVCVFETHSLWHVVRLPGKSIGLLVMRRRCCAIILAAAVIITAVQPSQE